VATTWLWAWVMTQAVEAPLWGAFALKEQPWSRRIPLAFLPSAITHPLLWFVFFPPVYEVIGYWPTVAAGEGCVVLVEGFLMAGFVGAGPWTKQLPWSLLLSLGINAASVGTGFLTQELFDWP